MKQSNGQFEPEPGDDEVEEGDFEIGNIDMLLDLVSSLDPDHIKAFVQFVLNSFDAFKSVPNRTDVGKIEIRFELKKDPPEIVISDYSSRGMDRDLLKRVPTKIGSSEKRQQWEELISAIRTNRRFDMAGYQAIGMYVYRRLCEYCMVVTRFHELGSRTYAGILPTKHGEKWKIYTEPTDRLLSGTDVHLIGVNPTQWTKKDIERLKNFLRREVRHQLRGANPPIELYVIEEGPRNSAPVRHRIMPAKFDGERLFEEELTTRWRTSAGDWKVDPTELELYHHVGVGGGSVEVWFGESRITDNICKIEGLNIPPFNSGELEGAVTPTFLIPDMGRNDFIRDSEGRFEAWIKTMSKFASELVERFELENRQARDNASRQFERSLRVAIREVGEMFDVETNLRADRDLQGREETPYKPPSGQKKARFESSIQQEVLDAWKEWVWDLLAKGIEDPDTIQKRIKNEHRVTLDKNTINRLIASWHRRGIPHQNVPNPDNTEERKRRATLMANINLMYQSIWHGADQLPVRSVWDEAIKVVKINVLHPDYVEVKLDGTSNKKREEAYYRYIAEVVIKTLIPVYYQSLSDPQELFERFVDFRNAIWEKLGLAGK